MPKTAKNYQSLNTELETILDALQASDLDIDKALELYKRGQKVVKELEVYLKTAENTVRKLSNETSTDD